MGTRNTTDSTSAAPLSLAEGGAPFYDVAVVGGGASGLAAAITAARAGTRCCIIERDVEAGLGILATGNGRCNISNSRLQACRYLHPHATREPFGDHAERDIAEFFAGLGLMFAEEDEGRLYPVTRRAESVRDVLLNACGRLGIDILNCTEVMSASYDGAWDLTLSRPASPLSSKRGRDAKAHVRNMRKALAVADRAECRLRARCVIVAVGGRSEGMCHVFDLPHLAETPVLCPISCALETPGSCTSALATLDGIRVEGILTLVREGAAIAFEQGEVLFRDYGISGIAAFNLSRRLAPDDLIELDLFPSMTEAALLASLQARTLRIGAFDGSPSWFDGLLVRPLSHLVCDAVNGADDPLARAAELLHRLRLRVAGTTEHAQAHVHRGGIPLSAINLSTCAVYRHADGDEASSLYACGEALDMDADCGGYNLAWAWVSGMRAGTSAAKGVSC